MHAQEWITTSTACWIIQHLLAGRLDAAYAAQGPSKEAGWRPLAERFEWHVFPNVNPDGYEYSFVTVCTLSS